MAHHLQRHLLVVRTDGFIDDSHPASAQPTGDAKPVHVTPDQHVSIRPSHPCGDQAGQELAEFRVAFDQRVKGLGGQHTSHKGFLGNRVGRPRFACQQRHLSQHVTGSGSGDHVPLTFLVLGHHQCVPRGDHEHLLSDVSLVDQVFTLLKVFFLETGFQERHGIGRQSCERVRRNPAGVRKVRHLGAPVTRGKWVTCRSSRRPRPSSSGEVFRSAIGNG